MIRFVDVVEVLPYEMNLLLFELERMLRRPYFLYKGIF
jgi:hypothetical protein